MGAIMECGRTRTLTDNEDNSQGVHFLKGCTKQGWLRKQSRYIGGWRKRWCVLKDGRLYAFKKKVSGLEWLDERSHAEEVVMYASNLLAEETPYHVASLEIIHTYSDISKMSALQLLHFLDDTGNCTEKIDFKIYGYVKSAEDSTAIPNSFEIYGKKSGSFYFVASSSNEKEEWMKAIGQECLATRRKTLDFEKFINFENEKKENDTVSSLSSIISNCENEGSKSRDFASSIKFQDNLGVFIELRTIQRKFGEVLQLLYNDIETLEYCAISKIHQREVEFVGVPLTFSISKDINSTKLVNPPTLARLSISIDKLEFLRIKDMLRSLKEKQANLQNYNEHSSDENAVSFFIFRTFDEDVVSVVDEISPNFPSSFWINNNNIFQPFVIETCEDKVIKVKGKSVSKQSQPQNTEPFLQKSQNHTRLVNCKSDSSLTKTPYDDEKMIVFATLRQKQNSIFKYRKLLKKDSRGRFQTQPCLTITTAAKSTEV